jgi:membrane associated rhomboid family serine protease
MTDGSTYVLVAIVAVIFGSLAFSAWQRFAFTTVTIFANFIIFLMYFPFSDALHWDVFSQLGMWNRWELIADRPLSPLTHMYVHADFFHFLFNMLILFLMGMPFEERVGKRNMAFVYLFTGIVGGGLLTAAMTMGQDLVVGIGASAAISGVLGAFAVMYPNDRVPMVLVFILVDRVPVALGALVFIVFQSIMLLLVTGSPALGEAINIGFLAHIMGVITGVALGFIMLKLGLKAPEKVTASQKRMEGYDLESLRPLANRPALAEKLDALVAEDIPEVREVLLEDFVSRARCPDCDSILVQKGASVRCEGCDFRLDLRSGRSG